MRPQIFLDTNVQVYAAGRAHPLRQPCVDVLALAANRPRAFFTDVEVLQELLHRYLALRAWEPLGRASFESFSDVMEGRVEPIYVEDAQRAASLADEYPSLDARDLLHVAVMNRVGATRIVSTDTGFDLLADIYRLNPADAESWRKDLIEDDDAGLAGRTRE